MCSLRLIKGEVIIKLKKVLIMMMGCLIDAVLRRKSWREREREEKRGELENRRKAKKEEEEENKGERRRSA